MERSAKHWTLDDISWSDFRADQVDPEILKIVKAASLVERNGRDYASYLCSVFAGDAEFMGHARRWGKEEIQHGEALARWAKLADPDYDFADSFKRFSRKIVLPLSATDSVRGSRTGELIARCLVEVGTSSYYSALVEATTEPVLKEICRRIAADELRHYRLFYSQMKRYQRKERLTLVRRLFVAFWRIGELEDDELAYAYYAANAKQGAYDRRACNRACMRRAYRFYRPHHIARGVAMVFKAVGLRPHSRWAHWATRLTCRFISFRAQRLAAASP